MKYRFLNYTLNTKTSELCSQNNTVLLKQKPYLLLLCLLQNPQQILSKDFLLKEVWHDRLVSDNTIAQTVAQLRQLLEDDGKQPEYIITHRGRGISFTPAVEVDNTTTSPRFKKAASRLLSTVAIALGLLSVLWFFIGHNTEPSHAAEKTGPSLLFLSADNSASDDWLQSSVPQVFSGLIGQQYQGKVSAELLAPETNFTEYLDKQWEINPNLNVVTTQLSQNEFGYQMTLQFTDNTQNQRIQRFNGSTVNDVLLAASEWLNDEMDAQLPELSGYLPDDAAVVELYMRGVAAENNTEYDKAGQYFELTLAEHPDFHLARLELAGIKKQLGAMDEALVLLDTLQNTDLYPQIELQATEIRGYIYGVQGRFEDAQTLFEQTIDKYPAAPPHLLNPLRFELSYTLTSLNQLPKALEQLQQIEQTTTLASDPLLYADTLHKKASIYQSLGQTSEAEIYAYESLNTYLKLNKLLGAAKSHSLLARIFTLKSDFEQAKHHLYETLSITKNLDYKLGVGAGINELVYILLREGDFDQAEKLIAEMQEIAIEIEYTHMLIAAKQHAATLAIGRGDWEVAKQYLKQQQDIGQSSNNQTALMTGRFLHLDYYIASGNTEGSEEFLEWLDTHVDKQQNPRQHIALELSRAQLKLIDGLQQEAVDLLIVVKDLTEAVEDNESLVKVNNVLAEIYLPDRPAKALEVIEENKHLNAVAYPYLLTLSKALKANGQLALSLAAAIECKNKSGQRWKRQDEAYLTQLRLLVN